MGFIGYFGSRFQPGLFLHFLEPFQADGPNALEIPGAGTGLPDPGPVIVYVGIFQLVGDGQHLLFRFGAAGPGDHQRVGQGHVIEPFAQLFRVFHNRFQFLCDGIPFKMSLMRLV